MMSSSRIVVDLLEAVDPSSYEDFRRFQVEVETEYKKYISDVSKVCLLYAMAHDFALRHRDARIIIYFKEDKHDKICRPSPVFHAHPALLPENVTLQFSKGKKSFKVRGAGPVDQDYHANLCHLKSLAELEQIDQKDTVLNTAANVDFYEFLAYRAVKAGAPALAVMLDADNCLYNMKYKLILIKLLYKYAEEIEACSNNAVVDESRKEAFIKKLMQEITDTDLSAFNDDECDAWIDHLDKHGNITDADLQDDYRSLHDDRYKTVIRQAIRNLNKISPVIIAHILLHANEGLFRRLVRFAILEKCAGIVLMVGSKRQSVREDYENSRENATGLFIHDLHELVKHLNQWYKGSISFTLDRFLLADAYNALPPGESYKRALTKSAEHAYSILDNSKSGLLFACAHHIKLQYPGTTLIKFCDDEQRIFSKLKEIYHDKNHHVLLPRGLHVQCILYDGEFINSAAEFRLSGSGEIDANVYDSLQRMASLSGVDLERIARGPVVHNIGLKLDFELFALSRDMLRPEVRGNNLAQPLQEQDAHDGVIELRRPAVRMRQLGGLFRPVLIYQLRPESEAATQNTEKPFKRFT